MMQFNIDDYYGNYSTLMFNEFYPTDTVWVEMKSQTKKVSATLEITRLQDKTLRLETIVMPQACEYEEHFSSEKEICDWIRSLSYKYGLRLVKSAPTGYCS